MGAEQSVYEAFNTCLEQVDAKRRFGKTERPVQATETYRRVLSTLLRSGIRVEKWVLINERDHSVTFASTYNGITGAHYDSTVNTEWLSWDAIRSLIEDYQYVPADECPIAQAVSRLSAGTHCTRKIA